MAAVARAGTGVGFISVGFPAIPVMSQRVGLTTLRTGGAFGAGCYAESTFLRFDVFAASAAGAGVPGIATGFPVAPVVRPVRLTEGINATAAQCFFRACGFLPALRPVILCIRFFAPIAVKCVRGLGFTDQLEIRADTRFAICFFVIGHRSGCYKEQRHRQETCSQPFFHLLFLLHLVVLGGAEGRRVI